MLSPLRRKKNFTNVKLFSFNLIFHFIPIYFNLPIPTYSNLFQSENVEVIENEKNFANDGIATVSIIDGVQKEPHLNGGGSSG